MGMNVGTGGDEEGDVMVDINTTPLIDVMLVLIIMLIITIPIQTHAVKMNMPVGQSTPPEPTFIAIVFSYRLLGGGSVMKPTFRMPARWQATTRRPTLS